MSFPLDEKARKHLTPPLPYKHSRVGEASAAGGRGEGPGSTGAPESAKAGGHPPSALLGNDQFPSFRS